MNRIVNRGWLPLGFLGLLLGLFAALPACQEESVPTIIDPAAAGISASPEVAALERRMEHLERQVKAVDSRTAGLGGLAFLFGVVCALWAQNSGRSPWLWFILGALFSVIASAVMLWKNAQDGLERATRAPAHRRPETDGSEPANVTPPVR